MSLTQRLIHKIRQPKTREFAIYLGSTLCTKFIPFLALPLVTAILGPEEYGKWALFIALVTFALPLAGGTMSIEIWRHYYKQDATARAITIQNVISLIIICGFLLFLLLLPLLFFEEILSLPSLILLTIPFILIMQNIVTMTTKIFRFENDPKSFAIYEIGQGALMALLYTTFILGISANWMWFVISITLATFIFTITSFIHLYKTYPLHLFKMDAAIIKETMRVGLPMIPHLIGASFILMIDRIAIERMISLEAVGIYSIGIMVANALKILVTAIMKVWSPWLIEQLTHLDEMRGRQIAKQTWLLSGLLGLAAIGLWAAGYIYISFFFDKRFHPALTILPWAILTFYIQGLYQLFSHHIIFKGQTKVLMVTTFSVGMINLILTMVFIYMMGMVGAIIASAMSFALQLIAVFLYIQKDKSISFFNFSEEKQLP